MPDPAKIDTIPNPDKRLLTDSFAALCHSRAMRYGAGELGGQEAWDWLYDWALTRNLIDAIGDDGVQEIIAEAFAPYRGMWGRP
jgi:hypothetical protein